MNKALHGLCNGAEVSVRLQEIQYEMNGFGKHMRSWERAPNEQSKGNTFIHTSVARPAQICMVFETQLVKPSFSL